VAQIKSQKSKIKNLLAPAMVLLATTVASAESVWVKNATVDVREGKGAVFPSLGVVQKGQELTVLSRDGNWVQVQSGSVKGWVSTTAISTAKVNGDFAIMPAGAAAANMNTGIAARGLNPDAEQYVSAKRLNKAHLDSLIALRKSIPPAEYLAFTAPLSNPQRP
jgi:uncharacterized protein YraI